MSQSMRGKKYFSDGYNTASVLFHWITALWVVAMMVLGAIFHDLPSSHPNYVFLAGAHVILGLFGIFFFSFRVIRRLRNGFRPHPEHGLIERFLSRIVQYVFLVLLIVVPITGTLIVFGDGWELPFDLYLPYVDGLTPVVDWAISLHFVLTKVLLVTLILHIAGALKHALLDKDDTLVKILISSKGGR